MMMMTDGGGRGGCSVSGSHWGSGGGLASRGCGSSLVTREALSSADSPRGCSSFPCIVM